MEPRDRRGRASSSSSTFTFTFVVMEDGEAASEHGRRAHNPTDSIASCKDIPLEVNDETALAIVALSAALVRLKFSVTVSLSASLRLFSRSVAKATMVP